MIYCGICEGNKLVKECFYRALEGTFEVIYTGNEKNCPGCDGTGISEKARRENEKART